MDTVQSCRSCMPHLLPSHPIFTVSTHSAIQVYPNGTSCIKRAEPPLGSNSWVVSCPKQQSTHLSAHSTGCRSQSHTTYQLLVHTPT